MTTTDATPTTADRAGTPRFRGVDHCSLTVTDVSDEDVRRRAAELPGAGAYVARR